MQPLETSLYHYTDGELKELLGSMKILVDTREQANQHILGGLDKLGIAYDTKKLDYGDYSCYLPANSDLGILRDIHYTSRFAIERKGSLEELSGNLTKHRQQFENELLRASGAGCQLILMIEQGSWADIEAGKYATQFNKKAFAASLLSYQARYGLQIAFVNQAIAPGFTARTFHYWIRESLTR